MFILKVTDDLSTKSLVKVTIPNGISYIRKSSNNNLSVQYYSVSASQPVATKQKVSIQYDSKLIAPIFRNLDTL